MGEGGSEEYDFYTKQVLEFDKIRAEYLKAVPWFGL